MTDLKTLLSRRLAGGGAPSVVQEGEGADWLVGIDAAEGFVILARSPTRDAADLIAAGLRAALETESFQQRVAPWLFECFGPVIAADPIERGDRLIEEMFELVQSAGYPAERVAGLRDFVWRRPVGDPDQEAGGAMVTLAAFCLAHGLDMHSAGERELQRIRAPEVIDQVRTKQRSKAANIAAARAPKSNATS